MKWKISAAIRSRAALSRLDFCESPRGCAYLINWPYFIQYFSGRTCWLRFVCNKMSSQSINARLKTGNVPKIDSMADVINVWLWSLILNLTNS
jgi:hypothetical protein